MADNCESIFQQLKEVEAENKRLQDLINEQEAKRVADAKAAAEPGREFVVRTKDGQQRVVTDKELEGLLQQIEAKLDSTELEDLVARGFERQARPVGADGKFQNYQRFLNEIDIQSRDDYAKLAEALTATWKQAAPDDFSFVTRVYDKDKIVQIAADAYSEFATSKQVGAALARDAAGFMTTTERLTRLRVLADSSKANYLDALEQILEFKRGSSQPVPSELRQQAFNSYKLALTAERHFSVAKRKIGQSLQSLQANLGDPRFFDYEPDTIAMTPADVTGDEAFASTMKAIADRGETGAEQLKLQIDTIRTTSVDPKVKLDKGWMNQHILQGNGLVKDSQLANLRTQLQANVGGNVLMNLYGPIRQSFENGYLLTPVGTKFSREAMGDGARVAWESAAVALDSTRSLMRQIMGDAFWHGKARYGGNVDLADAGALTPNAQDIAQVEALWNEPYRKGGPLNPLNIALTRNKMQAGVRLMFHYLNPNFPVKPALRALGAVDDLSAHFAYTFKLNNELRMRARMEGAQLGLMDAAGESTWIDTQLQKAFYQTPVTPEDVVNYRRQTGLGSDVADHEIALKITNERAGLPDLSSKEAKDAFDYSLQVRMQNNPGAEGSFVEAIDESVRRAKQHWVGDSLMPYWRAPFNQFLFDWNLGGLDALMATAKWISSENLTPHEMAKIKSAWTTTGVLLTMFAGLDAMGVIEGSGPVGPERAAWLKKHQPNSLKFGNVTIPYLGGLPILNTLFLWKDIKEAMVTGNYSVFDQRNAFYGILQVGTAQIVRQTGFGQLARLFDTLQDPERHAADFFGFLAGGQMVPFVGVERDAERISGFTGAGMYKTKAPNANERYLNDGENSLLGDTWRMLKGFATTVTPIAGAVMGGQRIQQDWMGTPLRLPFGVDPSRMLPGFPMLWPQANDKVYAELEVMGLLNPPTPMMTRTLDGVSMSDVLQKLYNDTYGTVKATLPPSARLPLSGKTLAVSFPLPVGFNAPQEDGSVIYMKESNSEVIDVAYILDKHAKPGRTFLEAARSLINDPVYQAMQDKEYTTGDLSVRDKPPAARRKAAATVLLNGLKEYYGLRTMDVLNGSNDPAAQDWRERRDGIVDGVFKESTGALQDLVEALGVGQ